MANKPCTTEVKTAIFFSIELSVINVETDRKKKCLLYLPLEVIKYSSHICWWFAEHKLQKVSITKHKYLHTKQWVTLSNNYLLNKVITLPNADVETFLGQIFLQTYK